ncbi:uncharacterized protein LOC143883068 [Tasmannia lanceolata]|uniref:uncharacterized protein LOC143883068 n=1 Tax=Tasmannia lanceolata TaxID=3420 RepID=UPI004063238E
MDDCRGYRGEKSYQKVPRNPSRFQNRRPPQGSWQPTVPSWEKKFCFATSSISWKQLCETKNLMSYYENIAHWNDSSGEEAFQNAKARFWAEINGFPCDIPLPNPDIYIDEIDWNSDIDPNLLLDLDKKPPAPSDEEQDEKLGWDSFNFPIPCTGWGDDEDPVNDSPAEPSNCPIPYIAWDDAEDPVNDSPAEPAWGNFDQNVGNHIKQDRIGWENRDLEKNSWENDGAEGQGNCDTNAENRDIEDWRGWESKAKENNSWENNGVNSCGSGHCDSDINKLAYLESQKNNGILETNNGNCWRREGGARNSSGYKTSRFQGDKHQLNSGWRNYRGRKGEDFLVGSMRSCGPVNHHLSIKSSNYWCGEKPVS